MEHNLKREDWDFSNLPADEWIPAVLWETRREYAKADKIVAEAKLWLAGKVSERKPRMRPEKRGGKRPRYNSNLSDADGVRIRVMAAFDECIPLREYRWLHNSNHRAQQKNYHCWLAGYLRPVLSNWQLPWLCLPANERQRLCKIYEDERIAGVVHIGSWWDAVGYFQQRKLDGGLPLKFDYSHHTSVLLTIDWQHSKKRILAAISKMLNQCQPADMTHIKSWNRHGKKDRDVFVLLERLAIMRLLHHCTLSEVKRLLPEPNQLAKDLETIRQQFPAPAEAEAAAGREETKLKILAAIDKKLRTLEWSRSDCQHREEVAERARQAAAVLPSEATLEKILRYETALERQLFRAMNQLERLQRRRSGENIPAPLTMEISAKA